MPKPEPQQAGLAGAATEGEVKGTSAGHLGRKATSQSLCNIPPPLTRRKQQACFSQALPLWAGLGAATHSCPPARIQPALPWNLHQLSTLQRSLDLPLSRSARDSITWPALSRHTPKAATQTDPCPGRKTKGHSSQHRPTKPSYHLPFSGCQSRGL